jgi:hypothetical protein
LIQKPYVVWPVLEEIIKRVIQQYVDAGFYIQGASQYVSPAFFVLKPKKSDHGKLEKLKEHFSRNLFKQEGSPWMKIIKELEDQSTFRLAPFLISIT